LALVEGWPLREGVLYLLGNVLGLSNALTDFSPESNTGKILDVIVSTWALLMTGTVMGIIAGLSLVTDLTENMPSSVWGFLRYVLMYIPLVIVISSFAAGGLMAAVEGWTLDVGFYFMVSSICGLSQPLVDQEPDSAAGILVEVLAICIELGFAGAIIGIIGAHPLVADLITKIEGDHVDQRFANLVDEVEELADSHGSQIKEGGNFRQKALTLSKILRIQGCLPAEPTVEEIKNVFAMLDKDGNGSLDISQVKEAFASLGVSGDDVGSIFTDLDGKGDGHTTLDEFLKHFNERAGHVSSTSLRLPAALPEESESCRRDEAADAAVGQTTL